MSKSNLPNLIPQPPQEDPVAGPKKGAGKRRTGKDPMQRPRWLPQDWRFEAKVRTSGATRGRVDRYYYDPSGLKFRSKIELVHFLIWGNKLKRKSKGDAPSSASLMSKQKKSSGKGKDPQPQGV